MTPDELRAIRERVAPHMGQREFARCLGYTNANAYHRYEVGGREIPFLLELVMLLLDELGELPEWMESEDEAS